MEQKIDLMQYLDNRFNSIQWTIIALGEYMESQFPGAKAEIERREFYHRCWSFMMGREVAKKKAPPDKILVVLSENNKVIDKLRQEAEERGWMSEFNRAEVNSSREAQEMYGR